MLTKVMPSKLQLLGKFLLSPPKRLRFEKR
jgi:hypothetical protein